MLKAIAQSALHPSEFQALIKLKYQSDQLRKPFKQPLNELATTLGDVEFCYAALHKVSRSFAVVIQQLPEELRDAVCIFYLVLRGLDSVEDDMSVDSGRKVNLLRDFYNVIDQDGWNLRGVGDSEDYRTLLAHFQKVISVFRGLKPQYQAPIRDITRRMGEGMAQYATKEGSIRTVESYNLYCHYVAGLVGHGLSDLFVASGLEDAALAKEDRLANNMGLFLQKTNIIRDYLEDLVEGRTWWPKEIWQQYADNLEDLRDHPTSPESIACLNAMVTDALSLVPDVLAYLSMLRNPQIFIFCAIPQVMAIATLAKVYNNPKVYTGVCKIRKGLGAKMMLSATSMSYVSRCFQRFTMDIQQRIPGWTQTHAGRRRPTIHAPDQRTKTLTTEILTQLRQISSKSSSNSAMDQEEPAMVRLTQWIGVLVFIVSLVYCVRRLSTSGATLLLPWAAQAVEAEAAGPGPIDYLAMLSVLASVLYLFRGPRKNLASYRLV